MRRPDITSSPVISRINHLILRFQLVAFSVCLVSFCLVGAADAQQPAPPRRIGVLLAAWSPDQKVPQAFRQGMLDAGYSEGRDVVIEWRSAGGDYARGPELVASLLKSNVDVLIVSSTPDAQAAKRATSTTPIVVVGVSDPVGSGLAASLAHPGGNITGLSMMITDISAKRLQLLKEAIPQVATVAVVWNPDNPNHPKALSQLKAVARSLSIELSFVEARAPEQLAPAFSAVSRKQAKAIYVLDDAFLFANRAALLKLAAKARLPLIYGHEELAHEGALMSYGPDRADLFRRSAHYVDRLLRGAKPSDLPIEQPTKFELIVNLKTAKTLGLTIPRSFLERADEVIQ